MIVIHCVCCRLGVKAGHIQEGFDSNAETNAAGVDEADNAEVGDDDGFDGDGAGVMGLKGDNQQPPPINK